MKFKNLLFSSIIAIGSLSLITGEPSEASANPITTTQTNTSQWTNLGSHKNVDLNKVWTISFSNTVSFNKIDAIVVKSGNTFVPVKLEKNAQNQLQVLPLMGYVGNTTYEMNIFLSNGLKYKMNFTTKDAARNADIEPNNNYLNAQNIYVNDHVKGILNSDDTSDFYKVTVPADGKLTISAVSTNGVKSNLYLYGAAGSDQSSIQSSYDKVTNTFSAGLAAGTYYIRVAGKNNTYELTTDFIENEVKIDNATNSYIQAPSLELNSEVTGHIGFVYDNRGQNKNDYYKITLPTDGQLILDATQVNGGQLDLFIYGKYGNDKSSISSSYDKATHKTVLGLQAGTYYIRINDSGYYGAYSLKNTFIPAIEENDSATSNYITAPAIPINTTVTGHLGYLNDEHNKNENDYYKLTVTEAGTLQINATQLQGGQVDLFLYGESGSDKSSLKSVYDAKQATITTPITPGTYYIRINYSGYYGTYELSTQLNS